MRNEKLHKKIHNHYVQTIQEVIRMIDCWQEYKNSQPCPHERNKSIAEVLATVKKQKIDEDMLDDLMMAQEIKTIGKNGIRFLKSDYYDDTLYGLRDKVFIKYSLFDLSKIKVFLTNGKYLCTAQRVMPTHPMAEHLGDIKDMEDFKQKIVKQKQLKRKTLKAVKEFYNLDDIKKLEKDLNLMSEKPIDVTPKLIQNVKVKANSELTRPIFKSKFKRYEWHLNNCCITDEDRRWFENYKKSDEYKMIYGE